MSFLKRKNTTYKTYLERTRKKGENEGREGGEGIKIFLKKEKRKEKKTFGGRLAYHDALHT